MKSGIYKITNKITGKCYIGSAIDLNHRWACHRYDLRKQRHHSKYLQRSWNKHGKDVFEFSVLELVENKEHLIMREQHWINWFDAVNVGYNNVGIAGSNLGMKHSEEAKKKMSVALKKAMTEERRKQIGDFHRGRVASKETRLKMSKNRKGVKRPEIAGEKATKAVLRAWKTRRFRENKMDICERKNA